MDTVAITGANRGIGLATAELLASRSRRVVMICRDRERGRTALAKLAPLPDGHEHHLVVADLASLASVREGAGQILALGHPLAALVNNAAVLPKRRELSPDGFELQLAVTHLGHFLLASLLLPLLRGHSGAGRSRVVTISSVAHAGSAFELSDPAFERRKYGKLAAYQQSKLANVLFTKALARRVSGDGIEPVALHPGVYDTQLLRDYLGGGWGTGAAARVVGKNAKRAAPIIAELAAGRRDEDLAGAYLDKGTVSEPSVHARDREAQEALWEWSEQAVGLGAPDSAAM